MSSFEPIVLIYGSPLVISSANLRLPVSSLFAFDEISLEQIVNISPSLCQPCLNRYFVILLESIDKDLLKSLYSNHRVISIYDKEKTMCDNSQDQLNRMKNSFKQITLDLSSDIVRFLTCEGEKQLKLERIDLVKIYYQQARILKEWIMAFFKAEPSDILLISLNSSQQNLDNAQQRLENICTKLGYSSTVIRQLNNYIPDSERHSSLLPYSKLLFNNESPNYICQLIKKLSPIRLYLYGNELSILSEWSKLMIESENDLMDDEDNWCAFIENEFIDNEVKWNFGFMFGKNWKISRVSPVDLNQLTDDPRFQSALRRSHITFSERQIEVTANIFDWYGKCIEKGYLHIHPKLTCEDELIKSRDRPKRIDELKDNCVFRRILSFDYRNYDCRIVKSISFIWLDEMLYDPEEEFNKIIKPYEWNFFNNISECISFIEKQIRQQHYIFLIVSGTFGEELFVTTYCLMEQVFATYIYCAHLGPHSKWTKEYSQIRGVYNDSRKLVEHIKKDFNQLQISLEINYSNTYNKSIINQQNKTIQESEDIELLFPLPLTVYNPEEPHLFFGHQRTIDTLLCMPHTSQSKAEMIDEFRRIYNGNELVLGEIDNFEDNFHSNAAVQWYTKDSFICRTINKTLRSSDVDTMIKLRHILIDIYSHLNQSYEQRNSSFFRYSSEIYYRGQIMSNKQFENLKELQGNIISINTFLSTTTSMQIALMYAGKYHGNPDMTSVVFSIEKHAPVKTRPYANISRYSLFPDEEEVLFGMGSVFRIGNIRQLPNADDIWVIDLIMTDQQDYRFIKTP